ncbi:MAG TPA: DUF4097 family beta strand repeat-containing protein [Acidobacteriaceae bacterium]|jgi:DUF4097 and DUF4098 domain-containing protein YvlB
MPTLLSLPRCVAISALALVPCAMLAQSSKDWQKSYQVGSAAALSLAIDDTGAQIHSCGECQNIRIHVTSDDLSRFTIEERQDGQHVSFSMKYRPHLGLFSFRGYHTHIDIETPAKLDLDGQSSDGAIALSGTTGTVHLKTSDGSITLDGVAGPLDLTSSDGSVTIHRSSGSLSARTSDGSIEGDGRFDTLQLHSRDGSVKFALDPSTRLTGASSIETSDGSVVLHVPHDFAAAVSLSSRDGKVLCELPLLTQSYDSHSSSHSHIEGSLNGGSVPLTLRASDGSITVKAL